MHDHGRVDSEFRLRENASYWRSVRLHGLGEIRASLNQIDVHQAVLGTFRIDLDDQAGVLAVARGRDAGVTRFCP
jgi:hypothetical protein